jgi:hypothetical protein
MILLDNQNNKIKQRTDLDETVAASGCLRQHVDKYHISTYQVMDR